MRNDVDYLLVSAGFKKTEIRRGVLEIFLNSKHALTSKDIEAKLKLKADRVTLFRILKGFEEKCLIHRITDSNGQIQYALCYHNENESQQHLHNHVHFSCAKCHNTYCLDEIKMPSNLLPKGFKVNEWNLQAKGICKNCK